MTNEERILIAKLNTGELDGVVGDLLRTSGGSTVWTAPSIYAQHGNCRNHAAFHYLKDN